MQKSRREALALITVGAGAPLVAGGVPVPHGEPLGKDFAIGGYRLMARQPGYAVSVLTKQQYCEQRMKFDQSPSITCFNDDDWEVWFVRVPKGLEANTLELTQ